MRLYKIFAPLLIASMAGCATRAYIVADAPPPPREEVVVFRPGQVWIHGHWERHGPRWAWRDGHYERERPGYVYIEGRWQHSGRDHVWVDGGWRRRTTGIVRR